MEKDFNNYPPFMDFGMSPPVSGSQMPGMEDPFFNPMVQYEQAYIYYRYLCMQMEYKIKCKEFENLNRKCQGNCENTRDSNNSSNLK